MAKWSIPELIEGLQSFSETAEDRFFHECARVLMNLDSETDQLNTLLTIERAKNQALVDKIVRIQSLMCPADIEGKSGQRWSFNPPDELIKDYWRGLSQAIRELDDVQFSVKGNEIRIMCVDILGNGWDSAKPRVLPLIRKLASQ